MNVLRDCRLGLRQLRDAPGYAAAVVLTLALAVGVNSAVFSAVYAVLLSPLGITAPADLIVGWKADPMRRAGVVELSHDDVERWSTATATVGPVAAVGSSNWTKVLDGVGDPVRVPYAAVTAPFFDTLGARPLLGRTFAPRDDAPGAPPVVVLGYGAWMGRFGGRADIVGTPLWLDGKAYTVVGVMPKAFTFPRGADFWAPLVPELSAISAEWHVHALSDVNVVVAVARLRPGVRASEAQAAFHGIAASASGAPTAVVVTPFLEFLFGPVRPAFWVLTAAVALVLLIACLNVSGLMLARVSRRAREQAIHLALGATRARLSWLVTIETLLLCSAGGLVGLATARGLSRLIVWLGPDDLPRLSETAINGPVVLFTFATVVLTALACGLGPMRRVRTTHTVDLLASGSRTTASRGGRRGRALAVGGQLGLAVVLLVGTGLVVRSFAHLRALDLGFHPSRVLSMNVTTRTVGPTAPRFGELLARLSALHGVEAAGAVSVPPLAFGPIGDDTSVLRDGQPDTPAARRANPTLNHLVATPGYFAALRIPLKAGRLFDTRDTDTTTRVAILGESAAAALWPGQDPIGRRLTMPMTGAGPERMAVRTVIGVVADVHYRGLTDVRLDVYDAARQVGAAPPNLVIRTAGDPVLMVGEIERAVRMVEPQAVIDRVDTMEATVARVEAPWRLLAWVFSLFAVLAAGLAALGLFSVVNLDVGARRHEFAVRLALGAAPRAILAIAVASASRAALLGVLGGMTVAAVLSQFLTSLLFDVRALDPWSYASAVTVVIVAVAVAVFGPARQAAATDPMALLRRE